MNTHVGHPKPLWRKPASRVSDVSGEMPYLVGCVSSVNDSMGVGLDNGVFRRYPVCQRITRLQGIDARIGAVACGNAPRYTSCMELDPCDLDKISAVTLQHYDAHAEDFRDGTSDHDVTQNIAALLHPIEVEPPLTILGFGCGPGRDLKAFTALGHCAVGLDGAERFVAMARDATGCDVWQQDFLHLDLPAAHFDGIFANASLFHVPSQALPRVLRQLPATLKLGGVLFSRRVAARAAAVASQRVAQAGRLKRQGLSPCARVGLDRCWRSSRFDPNDYRRGV